MIATLVVLNLVLLAAWIRERSRRWTAEYDARVSRKALEAAHRCYASRVLNAPPPPARIASLN